MFIYNIFCHLFDFLLYVSIKIKAVPLCLPYNQYEGGLKGLCRNEEYLIFLDKTILLSNIVCPFRKPFLHIVEQIFVRGRQTWSALTCCLDCSLKCYVLSKMTKDLWIRLKHLQTVIGIRHMLSFLIGCEKLKKCYVPVHTSFWQHEQSHAPLILWRSHLCSYGLFESFEMAYKLPWSRSRPTIRFINFFVSILRPFYHHTKLFFYGNNSNSGIECLLRTSNPPFHLLLQECLSRRLCLGYSLYIFFDSSNTSRSLSSKIGKALCCCLKTRLLDVLHHSSSRDLKCLTVTDDSPIPPKTKTFEL